MRLVLPALVCRVGSFDVLSVASLPGSLLSFMRYPVIHPSDNLAQGVAVAPPLIARLVHTREKQRYLPLALTFSFCDEWGSITGTPHMSRLRSGRRWRAEAFRRSGQARRVRACLARVLFQGSCDVVRARCQLDRARSWESSGPRIGCRAGIRTQGERRIGPSATPIPLAWSPFAHSGTRQKQKAPRGEPGGAWNQLHFQAANPAQAG